MLGVLKRLPALLHFVFYLNRIFSLPQNMAFNVEFHENEALFGHSFLNITDMNLEGCMGKCLENFLCQSFQLCDGKECQLCSSNRNLMALRERQGCTYYEFEGNLFEFRSSQRCGHGCIAEEIFCRNGGTCYGADGVTCTTCTCPPGFTGSLCEQPIRSCRSYADGKRIPGKYLILNHRMQLYEVFCDFHVDSTMTWTLIQSYQLKNVKKFRSSFYFSKPVVNLTSWSAFRPSRKIMKIIQSDSTKWRMTCQYDSEGVVYTDYIRGSNEKIDILKFDGEQCVEVEFIDIRGKSCSNCTAFLMQSHTTNHADYLSPLHSDSYRKHQCTFRPHTGEFCKQGRGEDNFGYYYCVNHKHRCSASSTATSQTWFGG